MRAQLSKKMTEPDFQVKFTDIILTSAGKPNVISFAGGLPNPDSFPIEGMKRAADKVFDEKGVLALQYNGTQGYLPLREWIADRYKTMGVYDVTPEDIIITTGSQQAMNLMCAALLDPGDKVIVENPTYLVALQSFHLFDPEIIPVTIRPNGIDCDELEKTVKENPDAKLLYLIPNFQNPTGLSYSAEVHEKVVEIIKDTNIILLEDNPYRELRFAGQATDSFGKELGEQCCMLGTFSKIVSPGIRVGWICVRNKALATAMLNYKSTMDFHTSMLDQVVLAEYLGSTDIDAQIAKNKVIYKHKAEFMMDCLKKYLPEGVEFTPTEGGMFLWVKLPSGITSMELFNIAIDRGVAICPGDPFYETERNVSTFRINYSNSTDEAIETGVKILSEACEEILAKKAQ